jgi:hypothetical protein
MAEEAVVDDGVPWSEPRIAVVVPMPPIRLVGEWLAATQGTQVIKKLELAFNVDIQPENGIDPAIEEMCLISLHVI